MSNYSGFCVHGVNIKAGHQLEHGRFRVQGLGFRIMRHVLQLCSCTTVPWNCHVGNHEQPCSWTASMKNLNT